MKQPTVGVIGSINVDLLLKVADLPGPGHTVLGEGGTLSPGGKGANQALAAARQGAAVTMVGAVGDDSHADAALALLRGAGVDLSHVHRVPGPTGLAVVAVEASGENNIIVVSGANTAVNVPMIDESIADLRGCAVVILQGEVPVATTEHAARALSGPGTRIVLNLAPVIALDPGTIRLADPLIVNEHEAGQALAQLGADVPSPGADPVEHGRALCRSLLDTGLASVIVTLGSKGALVGQGDGIGHVPSQPVAVVDTTGAGDALVGAVAAGLARGLNLLEACALGVSVAGTSVQGPGAQESYPWAPGEQPQG